MQHKSESNGTFDLLCSLDWTSRAELLNPRILNIMFNVIFASARTNLKAEGYSNAPIQCYAFADCGVKA